MIRGSVIACPQHMTTQIDQRIVPDLTRIRLILNCPYPLVGSDLLKVLWLWLFLPGGE